ncbi:hypothetical protein BTI_4430 [Burkholderia thailandensis MSMB121]|nr:hypothetical protein BTI_4430 [Burkholderia thailandensis MSMB121]
MTRGARRDRASHPLSNPVQPHRPNMMETP